MMAKNELNERYTVAYDTKANCIMFSGNTIRKSFLSIPKSSKYNNKKSAIDINDYLKNSHIIKTSKPLLKIIKKPVRVGSPLITLKTSRKNNIWMKPSVKEAQTFLNFSGKAKLFQPCPILKLELIKQNSTCFANRISSARNSYRSDQELNLSSKNTLPTHCKSLSTNLNNKNHNGILKLRDHKYHMNYNWGTCHNERKHKDNINKELKEIIKPGNCKFREEYNMNKSLIIQWGFRKVNLKKFCKF